MIKPFLVQAYSFPREKVLKYFLTLEEILLLGNK